MVPECWNGTEFWSDKAHPSLRMQDQHQHCSRRPGNCNRPIILPLFEHESNADGCKDESQEGSDDGSSDTSNEGLSELEKTYEELQDGLDGLDQLAFKTRSASHRSFLIRPLSFKHVDEMSGEDLFLSYADHDRRYVCGFLRLVTQLQQPSGIANQLTPDPAGTVLTERLSKVIKRIYRNCRALAQLRC
jgi:hypothetical protein